MPTITIVAAFGIALLAVVNLIGLTLQETRIRSAVGCDAVRALVQSTRSLRPTVGRAPFEITQRGTE